MSLKKIAIAAGVLAGFVVAASCARDGSVRNDFDEEPSRSRATAAPSRASRWIPWSFSARSPLGDARSPDLYSGPRESVEIRVVDEQGRPVSGTDVQVLASAAEYGAAGLDDEQYEAWLSAQGEDEGEGYDGSYGGRDVVERGRTDRKGVWLAQLKPGVEVTFVARDGSGREGASAEWITTEIAYECESENDCDEWSDEEREEMAAHHAEHETDFRGPTVITIEIAEVAVLHGQVFDESGQPVANATLELAPLSGGDMLEQHQLVASVVEGVDPFVTGDDGRFRIPLRMFGAFDLTVYAENMHPLTEPALQVLPGGDTEINLTMITAMVIAGVLRDAAGNPVGGALVHAFAGFESEEGSQSRTTSLEDGSFELKGLERGRHTLAVRPHGNFLPLEMLGVESGSGPLDLQLATGSTLRVELDVPRDFLKPLVDSEGSRCSPRCVARRLPVLLSSDRIGSVPVTHSWIEIDDDGHGSVDIVGLTPALYRVQISDDDHVTEVDSVYVGPAAVTPVHLRLPDPNRAPAVAAVNVIPAATRLDMSDRQLEGIGDVFGDGDFSYDEGYESAGTVETDEVVGEPTDAFTPDVTINPIGSGLIVLRAPGGPPERRLFGGDRVVAIEGQNVLEMDGWEALELLIGPKNTTCSLVVDRPATGQTITVDLVRTIFAGVGSGDY